MSSPTQIGSFVLVRAREGREDLRSGGGVHPDVRLGRGRDVAAAGRTPHPSARTRASSCGSPGSSRSASAMFVSGPVATSSTSPGRSRAEPTITSTADREEGEAAGGGGAARPSPRSPWTTGNGTWSRTSGRAAPCATSTSPRPAASSTASVFSVACSTRDVAHHATWRRSGRPRATRPHRATRARRRHRCRRRGSGGRASWPHRVLRRRRGSRANPIELRGDLAAHAQHVAPA